MAGIPGMADHIATLPDGQKAIALDALELHYALTAKNVGGADGPSRLWASAVVLRIREEMEQISEKAQRSVVGVWCPEESSLAEKILTRATGALALVVVSPLIAFILIDLRLERPGPAIVMGRAKQGSAKGYTFVLASGRFSQFVRRADLQILPSLWHLLNGDTVLRFSDFSEIVRFWKATRSSR